MAGTHATTAYAECTNGTLVDFNATALSYGIGAKAGDLELCFHHNSSDSRSKYTIAAALGPQQFGTEGYSIHSCTSTTSSTSTTTTFTTSSTTSTVPTTSSTSTRTTSTTVTSTTVTSTTVTATTRTFDMTGRERPDLCINLENVEAAIPSPYAIKFDANEAGKINDGGNDMYDSGNLVSTSVCSSPFPRYSPNTFVPSDCFGAGGSYLMLFGSSAMAVVSQNYLQDNTDTLSIKIEGNLGADGSGQRVVSEFSSGKYTGYLTATCGGGDPTVNHLFIVDKSLSPNAVHPTPPSNTDIDTDEVRGIGPGSPAIYVLYASVSDACMADSTHREIFKAAVNSLAPCPTTITSYTVTTTSITSTSTTTVITNTTATTTTTTTLECQPVLVNVCALTKGTLQVDNTPCLATTATSTTTTTNMATTACSPIPVSYAFEFDFFVSANKCTDPIVEVPVTWDTFIESEKRHAAHQRVYYHYDGRNPAKIVERFADFRTEYLETLRGLTSSTTTTTTTTTSMIAGDDNSGEDVGDPSDGGEAGSSGEAIDVAYQPKESRGVAGRVIGGIVILALVCGFAFWRRRKTSSAAQMDDGGAMYVNTIPMTNTATLFESPERPATSVETIVDRETANNASQNGDDPLQAGASADIITPMLTVRSNRVGLSSQEFIVPMMAGVLPNRRHSKRNDGADAGVVQEVEEKEEASPPARPRRHGGGRPVGGIRAAASAADLEVYEPMVNSVFYPGPSASININDADGRTGNDSSARNYADPSSQQQLYAAAPAAATQNYSDASTSRLYPQESGERLGDYVNSDAAAGIVGIVGAPPSQAHIYENSTVNATTTTA